MSAAVAGAAALACSDICSTSAFRSGSGAGHWPWDRDVRRARVPVSTLFADLAGHLVKVGPVLALNGSTGQARRVAYFRVRRPAGHRVRPAWPPVRPDGHLDAGVPVRVPGNAGLL